VSHQTGLPPNAYDNLIEAGQDADRVRARLADVDLICQPGQCYTYQNVAFAAVEA
jgi:beta-lactamase class C